jgi:hypothetical protein
MRFAQLLTWLFWRNALIRATRTALVIAVPYFGGVLIVEIPWLVVASAAGFGFVLSILTNLSGLVEAGGGQVSWWYAILERITKTAAQALVTAVGTATLFEQVEWNLALQSVGIAAIGSLLLGFITKLPEADTLPSAVQPVSQVASYTIETTQGVTLTAPSLDPAAADIPLTGETPPASQ